MQGRIQQVPNIKLLRSAVRLCAAISEEQTRIIFGPNKFCLKASNDSLTSIVAIDFKVRDFFAEFCYDAAESELDSLGPEKEDVVAVTVKSRLLLQSMRLLAGIKACHMVNKDDNGYFVICFTSDEGCRRAYYFGYEQADTPIARIESFQHANFRCCVKPKFLHEAMRNFSPKLPEIRFIITKKGIQIKAFDDSGPKEHVETEIFLHSFDMTKYEFHLPDPQGRLTVRIPASEIRAMLQFCTTTDTLLMLECQEPGQPVCMTSVMDQEKINFRAPPYTTKMLVQTVFDDNYLTRPQVESNISSSRRVMRQSFFGQSVQQAAANIGRLEASQESLPTLA